MSADQSAHDGEHESFIKTPKQLIVVGVLSFAVPVIFLMMLAQFVISGSKDHAASASPEVVAARIKPVADVTVAAGDAAAGGARSGEDIVKNVCSVCHGTGAAGSPKIGDKAAWAPRLAQGLDGLLKNAIHGKGAMPPRGGLPDLSDYEVARAIVYMTGQSGGTFKEPPPPAPAKTAAAKK